MKNNKSKNQIGKFLAKLRIDNEEYLEDMAKRLNIHKNHLSYIENGNRDMSIKLIRAIEKEYNLSYTDRVILYTSMIKSNKKISIDNLDKLNEEDLDTLSKVFVNLFIK